MKFNHLEELNIGYVEHAKTALGLCRDSLKASGMFLVHAIYPDVCEDTTNFLQEKINKARSLKKNDKQTNTEEKTD